MKLGNLIERGLEEEELRNLEEAVTSTDVETGVEEWTCPVCKFKNIVKPPNPPDSLIMVCKNCEEIVWLR